MYKVGDKFYSGMKSKIEIEIIEVLEKTSVDEVDTYKIKYLKHPRPERKKMQIVCSAKELDSWVKME